jgi:hypothetical protein
MKSMVLTRGSAAVYQPADGLLGGFNTPVVTIITRNIEM